ncbi:MAG TPA: hypothetical protein VIS76_10465 [Pseudomonadales bacterium]
MATRRDVFGKSLGVPSVGAGFASIPESASTLFALLLGAARFGLCGLAGGNLIV